MRVRPASRNAKPACMNITSTAVMTTQIVLAAMSRSLLDTRLHLLERHPGAVVDDVRDLRLPAQTVARLVPAPGGVGDRVLDRVGDLVADEERQKRLRQEPRLEHAASVLVRDPTLAPVTDRLDHGHADVARRIF